jgi:hypothetical protein
MKKNIKKYPGVKLGVVTGKDTQDLGNKVVNHVGLSLPEDDKIGKKVRFKNPEFPAQQGIFYIGCRQKMWGYNEKGEYVNNMEGYRVYRDRDDFGKPALPSDLEFIND